MQRKTLPTLQFMTNAVLLNALLKQEKLRKKLTLDNLPSN